jgi:hypothetical protein
MDKKEFAAAKKALLEIMKRYKSCAESFADAKKATTLAELVEVLNTYRVYIGHHNVNITDWLRTYFADKLELLNSYGIYLDQKVEVKEQPFVWLFGKCVCNYFLTLPIIGELVVADFSCALVHVTKSTLFRLYLVGDGIAEVAEQGEHAKIYIKDRRKDICA